MIHQQHMEPTGDGSSNATGTKKVFISYMHGADPDEALATQVYNALKNQYEVFIDRKMLPGTNWAERIELELTGADFFICFLSESSLASEMVFGEIEKAHHLSKSRGGHPIIIPVRIAYRQQYPYPLNAYLNRLSWVSWEKLEDTERIIETLQQVVAGGETAPVAAPPTVKPPRGDAQRETKDEVPSDLPPRPLPVAQLERPEGTMDLESKFYVERTSDKIALQSIEAQGVTIAIKGPRQVGKSSLLVRMREAAIKANKSVVVIDFQQIDRSIFETAERLLRHLCAFISYALKQPDLTDEYWKTYSGNILRATFYMEQHILENIETPLVVAMDDVDEVFDTGFRSDFFGMLRSWHNNRAWTPVWKKLSVVLVTSSEPSQFITESNQSPFNVAAVVEPEDFTAQQIDELINSHGLRAGGSSVPDDFSERLMKLLGGHPYLTRVALYEVASGNCTVEDLFANAASARGPFNHHFRYYLFWLHDKPELVSGLRQVITSLRCDSDQVTYRLQGAGLVRIEDRKVVLPRCELYAIYFRKNLYV